MNSRGRSSEARVDGELGGRDDKSPARGSSSASVVDGGRRRGSRQASGGEREQSGRHHESAPREDKLDWGMRSLVQATMTGYYHFLHSEPQVAASNLIAQGPADDVC